MLSARQGRGLVAGGLGLLLLGALATPASAITDISTCGTLPTTDHSFRLTADLNQIGTADCLTITQDNVTIDLNGHSISGLGPDPTDGVAITGSVFFGALPKDVTIKGPGVVHDWGSGIVLGDFALVQDVRVYSCGIGGGAGISLGNFSKCVQCRVHTVLSIASVPPLGGPATGIILGDGCLLESSIVETSDRGARVGRGCQVWHLVLESSNVTGLTVGPGTSVARTVVSHGWGPGIDYCACGTPAGSYAPAGASACQDSSNSVSDNGGLFNNIIDRTEGGGVFLACAPGTPQPRVVTDCATNVEAFRYPGAGLGTQCP
jgi:hypothetical protein